MVTIYVVELRGDSADPGRALAEEWNDAVDNPAQAVIQMDKDDLRAIPSQQRAQLIYEVNQSDDTPLRDKVVATTLLNATYKPGTELAADMNAATERFITGTPQFVEQLRRKYNLPDLDLDTPLPEEVKEDIIKDVNAYTAKKFGVPEPTPHVESLSEGSTEIAHYDLQTGDTTYNENNIPNLGVAMGAGLHEMTHDLQDRFVAANPEAPDAQVLEAAQDFYGFTRYGDLFYRTNPVEAGAFNEMYKFYRAFGA